MNKRYTLLLTACIDPSVSNYKKNPSFRMDTATRLNDYKIALDYWLNYSDSRLKNIVFIENSGFDISPLRQLVNQHLIKDVKVEFIEKLAGPVPSGVHYGYSELEMIDYAFKNSLLIAESDYIIKATGRLYFPKLRELLSKLPADFKIAIDSRDYNILKREKHFLVTTIFVFSKAFYNDVLYDAKAKLTTKHVHIEKLYFSILKPLYLNKENGVILRFPFSVDPVGIGAHFNVNYSSKKKRFESAFRDIVRVLVPNLWI